MYSFFFHFKFWRKLPQDPPEPSASDRFAVALRGVAPKLSASAMAAGGTQGDEIWSSNETDILSFGNVVRGKFF